MKQSRVFVVSALLLVPICGFTALVYTMAMRGQIDTVVAAPAVAAPDELPRPSAVDSDHTWWPAELSQPDPIFSDDHIDYDKAGALAEVSRLIEGEHKHRSSIAGDAAAVVEVMRSLADHGGVVTNVDRGLRLAGTDARNIWLSLDRVIDADTVVLRVHNPTLGPDLYARTRLLFIDAPEKGEDQQAEQWGESLGQYWMDAVPSGPPLKLAWPADQKAPKLDRFGRLLASVVYYYAGDQEVQRCMSTDAILWGAANYTDKWQKPLGKYEPLLRYAQITRDAYDPICRRTDWAQDVVTIGFSRRAGTLAHCDELGPERLAFMHEMEAEAGP
jgi:hypothetical protein